MTYTDSQQFEDVTPETSIIHSTPPTATPWDKTKEAVRLGYTRAGVTIEDLRNSRQPISKSQKFCHYYVDPLFSYHGKNERALVGPCLARVNVQDRYGKEQNVIHAAAHNYAGFYRQTPEAEELQQLCLDKLNLLGHNKTLQLEVELCRQFQKLFEADFCYTSSTGYGSNLLAFPAILDKSWAVVLDEKSHSSMLTGIYQSKYGTIRKFHHNDMTHLETILSDVSEDYNNILLAIEGLYSMDGTLPPMRRVQELKHKYGLTILADEAHSMLSVGRQGKGCVQAWNDNHPGEEVPMDLIDIRTATLSKATGGLGGIVCGTSKFKAAVRKRYLEFAANGHETLTPAVMVQCLRVLGQPTLLSRKLHRLSAMTRHIRDELSMAGLHIYGDEGPVLPIHTGRPSIAAKMSYVLRQLGVLVTPIGPPAVAWWEARLRLCLSADFDDTTVNELVANIIEAAQRVHLIPRKARIMQPFVYAADPSIHEEQAEVIVTHRHIKKLILSDVATADARRLTANIIDAGHKTRQRYGIASGAARWVTGTYDVHIEVEKTLAEQAETESAMTYVDTHMGLMSTIASLSRPVLGYKKHYFFVPTSAPTAVEEGIKISPRKGAPTIIRYNDNDDLVRLIKDHARNKAHITIYVDSTMSQQSTDLIHTISNWKESRTTTSCGLTMLLNSFELPHKTTDHRVVAAAKAVSARTLIFGSFSREFNLPGAYLAGDALSISELRYTSRCYMFTTSQLPYVMGMTLVALRST